MPITMYVLSLLSFLLLHSICNGFTFQKVRLPSIVSSSLTRNGFKSVPDQRMKTFLPAQPLPLLPEAPQDETKQSISIIQCIKRAITNNPLTRLIRSFERHKCKVTFDDLFVGLMISTAYAVAFVTYPSSMSYYYLYSLSRLYKRNNPPYWDWDTLRGSQLREKILTPVYIVAYYAVLCFAASFAGLALIDVMAPVLGFASYRHINWALAISFILVEYFTMHYDTVNRETMRNPTTSNYRSLPGK